MVDFDTLGPTPDDLATRAHFDKVRVPLSRLVEALNDANGQLSGRRFTDCFIHGPAVVVPGNETVFDGCNMGDAAGDIRNLFLKAAGPRIIGAIALNDSVFEGCVFHGVGFAGDDGFVARFIESLTPKKA